MLQAILDNKIQKTKTPTLWKVIANLGSWFMTGLLGWAVGIMITTPVQESLKNVLLLKGSMIFIWLIMNFYTDNKRLAIISSRCKIDGLMTNRRILIIKEIYMILLNMVKGPLKYETNLELLKRKPPNITQKQHKRITKTKGKHERENTIAVDEFNQLHSSGMQRTNNGYGKTMHWIDWVKWNPKD